MASTIRAFVVGLGCFTACAAYAQPSSNNDADAIRAVLDRQAVDWNRGDLESFAESYKNAPDILFIGPTIAHGYAAMLARYKAHYSTRAAMGTLNFTAIAVQPLDARFATVTGQFHLARSAAGGGDAAGYFLLVMEKTRGGWKIIRDDTTAFPKPCR